MDVFNFLTNTANPLAQITLTEMRYADVVFLLHQAEEESNAEKFTTALKFAATLYTTNHATKYTNMCAKYFMWWHCASEADKAVYEQLVMTRKTKAGKTIYMDRFIAWLVKGIRGGVGTKVGRDIPSSRKLGRYSTILMKN